MSKNISDKDKKAWKKFISSDEKIHNKDENFKQKKLTRTRVLDLHGYTLYEANKKIEKLIINSYEEKVNKLIIVTGKGLHSDNESNPYVSKDLSILKYSVPEFIINNSNLMSMIIEVTEAKVEDGGSGAFYIFLKKNKTK